MVYDPQLDRIDTTIRAMYRMYHGRLHDQLEEGLVPAFQDQPFPRTERMIFELIARCPAVVPVAIRLLGQYQWALGDERKKFYEMSALDGLHPGD